MADSDYLRKTEMTVSPCQREEIREFIEQNHYSRSIHGVMSSFCFKLEREGKIIGAMLYGKIAMPKVWTKYGEKQSDVIELRRLCLVDDTPKNAESFFIAKTLKWLKQNTTIKTVVSYADPNYGHQGTIYRAANFQYLGQTSKTQIILWNGKKYHDKNIRSKTKGELRPIAKRLREAIESGQAQFQEQLPKHIYIRKLKGK